jgi:hypothetical protein
MFGSKMLVLVQNIPEGRKAKVLALFLEKIEA